MFHNKLPVFLLFSCSIFVFCACTLCSTKEIPCAGFNEPTFNEWFPYDSGQVLVFAEAGSNEKDTITLTYFKKSEAYKATIGGYNSSQKGCTSNISIRSSEMLNSYSPKLQISYQKHNTYSSDITTLQGSIGLNNFQTSFGEITHDQLTFNNSDNLLCNVQDNYTLNGKLYYLVQIISLDSLLVKSGINKLYLARQYGIVGYEDLPDHHLWTKE